MPYIDALDAYYKSLRTPIPRRSIKQWIACSSIPCDASGVFRLWVDLTKKSWGCGHTFQLLAPVSVWQSWLNLV